MRHQYCLGHTYSMTLLFPIFGFIYKLVSFFYITFFFKPLLNAIFPVITMQRFDFKDSIIANEPFVGMVLNPCLTSE